MLDCESFCLDKGLICAPVINTNNETRLFEKLGASCSRRSTQDYYSESYHPAYNPSLQICAGYIGVPNSIICKVTAGPSNIQRVCQCLDKGNFLI